MWTDTFDAQAYVDFLIGTMQIVTRKESWGVDWASDRQVPPAYAGVDPLATHAIELKCDSASMYKIRAYLIVYAVVMKFHAESSMGEPKT